MKADPDLSVPPQLQRLRLPGHLVFGWDASLWFAPTLTGKPQPSLLQRGCMPSLGNCMRNW